MGICGISARTSIEQQRELDIKFCDSQDFQYQTYENIGKSRYKVDDDNDPFKNRPGISKLIDDIEICLGEYATESTPASGHTSASTVTGETNGLFTVIFRRDLSAQNR